MTAVRAFVGAVAFYLWWALITVFFSAVSIAVAPLAPLMRYKIIVNWAKLTIKGLAVCCNLHYRVRGAERIAHRPRVYLVRHESAWETIALLFILPPSSFLLKRSLLHIPFFGWGLRQMSPIAIDRAQPRRALRQLLDTGQERLRQGFNVIVFPEGTRMLPNEQRPYHGGGAALAKRAGVEAVAVAVDSGRFWGRNGFMKHPGTITVSIGEPIDCAERSVAEINALAKRGIDAARSASG